jgi:hypothetical protein
MNSSTISRHEPKRRLGLGVALIGLGAISCFVLVVFNTGWDAFLQRERMSCYARMADELGIEPTQAGIGKWIADHLVPGMSRDEVEGLLGGLAPLSINDADTTDNEVHVYRIEWQYCSTGNTNPVIFVAYDTKERLVSANLEVRQ